MYDTTERVRRAKHMARTLIRKQEQKTLRRLGTLCAALALGLTGALVHFTRGTPGAVQGTYGAMLLADSAGGYVLVGIVSFATAVAITVLCIRLRKKGDQNKAGMERSARHEQEGATR